MLNKLKQFMNGGGCVTITTEEYEAYQTLLQEAEMIVLKQGVATGNWKPLRAAIDRVRGFQ